MASNAVWYRRDKEWIKKEMVKLENNKVLLSDGSWVEEEKVLPYSTEELETIDDLTLLSHLNEPSILETVRKRYNYDKIYAKSGTILIAVNPFKELSIYGNGEIEKYINHQKHLPHPYEVARLALKNLKSHLESQTILASGESGSGKTVTTKHLLHYITKNSNSNMELEEKIIISNPLLEAFGNAQTVRNDNSSRFGKFIKLFCSSQGNILGAEIKTYLLEKIRVVSQNKGEKNYHIFYQVFHLLDDIKEKLLLNTFEYEYDEEDKKGLKETIKAMKTLYFTEKEMEECFKIISIILHLSKLTFENGKLKRNKYVNNLEKLAWDYSTLNDYFCHNYILAGKSEIRTNLSDEEAKTKLETLMQELYQELFNVIVSKINVSFGKTLVEDRKLYIGILDIFGFEIFKKNSLEQLHINYTNEYLQQIFNYNVFKEEQEIYKEEGLDWKMVHFFDNKERLMFIKDNLLKLLNSECLFPKGSDQSFLGKLENLDSNLIKFNKVKKNDGYFSFDHYAGLVEYYTHNFCHKNKHHLNKRILFLIQKSKLSVLQKVNINKKISIKDTISTSFNKQLETLIEEIRQTKSHFVRCIKPNDNNSANKFDTERVLEQLKYGGVIEAVRVSRSGYPVRFAYDHFVERYYPILRTRNLKEAQRVMKEMGLQLGKTKVFLKQKNYEDLEEQTRDKIYSNATIIQKNVKRWIHQKKYVTIKNLVINVQLVYKQILAKRKLLNLRRNYKAIVIQSWYKGISQKKKYNMLLNKVITIQLKFRAKKAQLEYEQKIRRKLISATVKIQRWYRQKRKILQDKFYQFQKTINKVISENSTVKNKLKVTHEVNEALIHKMNALLEENERLKIKQEMDERKRKKPWWSIFFGN